MPYPPKYKVTGRAPCRRQSLLFHMWVHNFMCASTHSWSVLCGGAHGASRAALTNLTLLSHGVWAHSMFSRAETQTWGILQAHRYSPYKCMPSWVCTCTCGMSAHADSCTTMYTALAAHGLWMCMRTQWPYVCMGWAGFPSPSFSLFSSLNGKRLSAISFYQQLGDTFLQLAAICFNYVY